MLNSRNMVYVLCLMLVCAVSKAQNVKNTAKSTEKGVERSTEKTVSDMAMEKQFNLSKNFAVEIKDFDIDSEVIPKSLRTGYGETASSDSWLELDVELAMSGQETLAEFEAKWAVIIETDTHKKPVIMTMTSKYKNLKKGSNNHIAAYLGSGYFEDNMKSKKLNTNRISAQIEIIVNGKTVAKRTKGKNKDLFSKKNRKQCVEGEGLLPRNKTPFDKAKGKKYLSEVNF